MSHTRVASEAPPIEVERHAEAIRANQPEIGMLPMKAMSYDAAREILKVQAGALWKDVIACLDPLGRSVAVIQSDHSFSDGGSLSVNCHGWQFDRPPIASTVESFPLMQVDGTIVRCSRTENVELFSCVPGGYGLFGIILDAELRSVPNDRYRPHQYLVPADQSLARLDGKIKDRPGVQTASASCRASCATR